MRLEDQKRLACPWTLSCEFHMGSSLNGTFHFSRELNDQQQGCTVYALICYLDVHVARWPHNWSVTCHRTVCRERSSVSLLSKRHSIMEKSILKKTERRADQVTRVFITKQCGLWLELNCILQWKHIAVLQFRQVHRYVFGWEWCDCVHDKTRIRGIVWMATYNYLPSLNAALCLASQRNQVCSLLDILQLPRTVSWRNWHTEIVSPNIENQSDPKFFLSCNP